MQFPQSQWQRVFWGVAGAWVMILLLQRTWFELQGTLTDDVHTYMAVGRGILNGLTPYVDLFESKPPGIFLLSALSLVLFDGAMLLKLLHAAVVLLVPLLAVQLYREVHDDESIFDLALCFMFSGVLTLYMMSRAGEGFVEPIGVLCSMIFALLYVRKQSTWIFAGVTLSIFCAIGLKEPFFLVLIALVLLLSRSVSQAVTKFLYPLAVAVILGLIALALLGYFKPYFSIYLPHMMGYHLNQLESLNGSFFERGFMVHRTLENMYQYSVLLPLLVGGVLIGGLMRPKRVTYIIAVYLLFLAVGTGGDFYPHHFPFIVPGLIVIFVLLLTSKVQRNVYIALAVLTIGVAVFHDASHYKERVAVWQEREQFLVSTAATIDTVLDGCDIDRYLHVVNKGGGPFGWTTHSPSGPIFIQFHRFMSASEVYRERFREALLTTPIIITHRLEETNLTDTAKAYINENYSLSPPPCAEPFTQPEPYVVLFRNEVVN